MEELMLKIDNVSKQYKLGQIGGTTLRDELQRQRAKRRGEEDPTKTVGSKNYKYGEKFMALEGVSFEVKKGERIGIIGHNGAGKSTLLKLISRVTAPTDGAIYLNGRVASMLEVGTGFHPELTGRENIYMNGAILGMTKKEIDSKIEDIIDFSECRQFIDTPVKRYSSGMYVKLAFSVAAHLDSEIMIMDEVLAVGDMAFQKKCLDKMNDVSRKDGRTILYVSHNMNTIRQLCDRVIVLNHGGVIFDGDVEKGIDLYLEKSDMKCLTEINLAEREHFEGGSGDALMQKIKILNCPNCIIQRNNKLIFTLKWITKKDCKDIYFRAIIRYRDDSAIGVTLSERIKECKIGKTYDTTMEFDTSLLAEGKYYFSIALIYKDDLGNTSILDHVSKAFMVEIKEDLECKDYQNNWQKKWWGSIHFPNVEIIEQVETV